MGIKNLKYLINRYASNAIIEQYLGVYENRVIAIDLSIYLYRFIYKNGEPLELLAKQIMRLLKNKIIPLYIFDGKPPKAKNEILEERSEKRKKLYARQSQIKLLIEKSDNNLDDNILNNNLSEDLINMSVVELKDELDKIEKSIIIINDKIINDCKHLFTLMGVPYITANGEAESLCAKLIKEGFVYGCISEDTDILANGGKYFLQNFNVNNNKIIEYDLDKILESFDVTYEQFIDICILCKCDYTSSIKNIGVEKAYKFIKEYKNIEGVLEYIDTENKKYIEKNKDIRYVVPEDFDYATARELFLTCGENEDIGKLRKIIKLEKPQVDSLLYFLGNNAKSALKNDIKRNIKKLYHNIETLNVNTIDKYF